MIIASRASSLARCQAQWVGAVLGSCHRGLKIQYEWIESEGDRLFDQSLTSSGGKGLFTSAVERALIQKKADLAVHSMKDLPSTDPADRRPLIIAAVPRRADPHDCLISRDGAAGIEQLPHGAVLGTSGPRRAAQAKRLRPDLRIEPLRGNIETRLRKIQEGALSPDGYRYDAALMAVAGLQRAGLCDKAKQVLRFNDVLPAAAQGALALQCRADDHRTLRLTLPLNDPVSAQAVHMERLIVAALHGDCHSPIAVLARLITTHDANEIADQPRGADKPDQEQWQVWARVLSMDGRLFVEVKRTGPIKASAQLAHSALEALKEHDAQAILSGAACE